MQFLRLLVLMSVLFGISSCVTVTEKPELISNNSLICEQPISKTVAILRKSSDTDTPNEVKKTSKESNVPSLLEQHLQSTHCFDKVKILSEEKDAKDFERTIKIQIKPNQLSFLKATGHIVWMFTSASTLFLLPYFNNTNFEVTLTDSKTGFTKSYFLKSRSTVHIFYFFTDWTLDELSSEIIEGIFEDYFSELKGQA